MIIIIVITIIIIISISMSIIIAVIMIIMMINPPHPPQGPLGQAVAEARGRPLRAEAQAVVADPDVVGQPRLMVSFFAGDFLQCS